MGDDPLRAGKRRAGSARRLGLWLATLAAPLGLLALAEGAARLSSRDGAPDDARLTFVDRPSFFETVEIGGRLHHRVSHPEAYRARNVTFPVEKEPGTIRIFCLGGSASAGWPHPPDEIYSAYLQRALERAFPERRFEVVNVGAHAYPAYRVRFIFDRAIEFDPDAVVIYSGNNEFLEKRTYWTGAPGFERLVATASRLALFRRLRRAWVLRRHPENALSSAEREHVAVGVFTKLARVAAELRRDPRQLAAVKAHYAESIEAMVDEAGRRGVPVVLATVPVNLRDWVPNVSSLGLEGAEQEEWRRRFDAGRRALLEGDPSRAADLLGEAVARAPDHAESHFRLARALEAAGRFEAALAEYRRAVDLDQNPFRALSDFNATLRAVAGAHAHVRLADLESAFLEASAPRAPGFDLFLDYVHPTVAGNRIAARAVFDALLASGALGDPGAAAFHVVAGGVPYDEDLDLEMQKTLFHLFGMMHQYEAMVARAEGLRARGVTDLPAATTALRVFRDYLYLERSRLLGRPVSVDEERRILARVASYYQHSFGFVP